jgi:CHAT domain
MSGQVSLMVTPTKLDNNEEGPPQFYVLRGEVWREVPLAGALGKPSDVRTKMDEQLTTIMTSPVGARAALVNEFGDFWNKWVPETVRVDVADLPRSDGDPPCLLLYVHPTLEWIPWELMHDGTDFLGLRYVIARLPIVRRGPSSMPEKRVVNRVCSFLAENLMDAAQEEEWEQTFAGLPNGVTVDRYPSNGVWPKADDVTQQAGADILHITCHGGLTDAVFNTVWTLNAQLPPHAYGLGQNLVGQMKFADQGGPLVFGNACQGAAGVATATGLVPGLAYSFFDTGATAFVGAFAPITKTLALKFATAFYGHLLGNGLTIGKALWQTKSDFDADDEQDPSWLFYCLYGAPATQFTMP